MEVSFEVFKAYCINNFSDSSESDQCGEGGARDFDYPCCISNCPVFKTAASPATITQHAQGRAEDGPKPCETCLRCDRACKVDDNTMCGKFRTASALG